MKNNLSCEIVEDLLPSYIEELTSEVTNTAVNEHMAECDKCKKKMENMKKFFVSGRDEEEKKEIDFLKKTRRKNIRTVVVSLISVLLVILIAFIALPYMDDEKMWQGDVYYNLEVVDNTFKLTVRAVDSDMVIKNIIREEYGLGEYGIDIRGRKRGVFDTQENYVWEHTYENIKSLTFFDRIIWEDGEDISAITSNVYAEKTPYIGDMSHNRVIASELMISKYLGTFENKLTTIKEPYGWELIFSYPYLESQLEEKESLMQNYAYVLMGVIGNLSEVTFTYDVIDSNGDDAERALKITKEQATKFFGEDIKKCSEDINTLQRLIEKTGLDKLPYINSSDEKSFSAEVNEIIYFDIFSVCEENITNISVWCEEDDCGAGVGYEKEIFSFGKPNINNVNFANFNYDLGNLNENLYSEERMGKLHFTFSVTVDYDKEYVVEKEIELSAAFGAVYSFILSGNSEDGFVISQH